MKNKKISLIGLSYIVLPLAAEFGKKRVVVGFDINQPIINDLKNGVDSTLETTTEDLKDVAHLSYTTNLDDVKGCEILYHHSTNVKPQENTQYNLIII